MSFQDEGKQVNWISILHQEITNLKGQQELYQNDSIPYKARGFMIQRLETLLIEVEQGITRWQKTKNVIGING